MQMEAGWVSCIVLLTVDLGSEELFGNWTISYIIIIGTTTKLFGVVVFKWIIAMRVFYSITVHSESGRGSNLHCIPCKHQTTS